MGNILENSKEFFDNMTDEEFEKLLDDMQFKWTKVEQGKGGLNMLDQENIPKDRYNVVFKALELACKQLESCNIEINNNTDFNFMNNKIHGTLVGYYLLKAEELLNSKEENSNVLLFNRKL